MENNLIKYEEIDKFLFKNIEWFEEYYFKSNFIEDLDLKYIVIWSLASYVKTEMIDKDFNIVNKNFKKVIDYIYTIYCNSDEKTKELIIYWFFEWILPENRNLIEKFKNIIIYDEFKDIVMNLEKFWYK